MSEIQLWKVFASLGIPGLALGVFYMLSRQFKWKFSLIPKIWRGPIVVLFLLLLSGVTFYALTLGAPASDMAVVRITVLGPDKMPVEDSEIWSSIDGVIKKVGGGWELEIAQSKLSNGHRITIYAEQKQKRLKGQDDITLNSKTTFASIQLERETSVLVKGNVYDENKDPVEGAVVSVVGEAGATRTDAQGFFTLPANKAEGEEVRSLVELLTPDLFRRHVGDGPDRLARRGQVVRSELRLILCRGAGEAPLNLTGTDLGEPEVEHLGVAAPGDEKVRGLDVSMHDTVNMRVMQSFRDHRCPLRQLGIGGTRLPDLSP